MLRVLLPLLAVLGALAWGATTLVNDTTRTWFMRDVSLRARLAANGARETLVAHGKSDERRRIAKLLDELTPETTHPLEHFEDLGDGPAHLAVTPILDEDRVIAHLPYDLEEASAALAAALAMSAAEQAERMRALRAQVADFNVYRWAGRMLSEAGKLRARDRLSNRLALGIHAVEELRA